METTVDELEEIAGALLGQGITNHLYFALACPDDDQDAQKAGAVKASALPQVAAVIEESAEEAAARFQWAPPVRFDSTRPLAEQVLAGPRTSADCTVRVQQDGSVLPPRGPAVCAGNLLTDTWEDIWNHPCFERYRERLVMPTRCPDCPGLAICAAACPKDPASWSDDAKDGDQR